MSIVNIGKSEIDAKRESFRIQTKTMMLGVRGTSFMVSLWDDQLTVSVKQGILELSRRDVSINPIEIKKRQKLIIKEGGNYYTLDKLSEKELKELNEINQIKPFLSKIDYGKILANRIKSSLGRDLRTDFHSEGDEIGAEEDDDIVLSKGAKKKDDTVRDKGTQHKLRVTVLPVGAGKIRYGEQICATDCFASYSSGT